MISDTIRQGARLELARRDFFEYCRLKAPDFYKRERGFLVQFCQELQGFYESEDEVLIVNMPPRHGKSRTVGCFVEWVLGRNQKKKIMTGSYNETLSTSFAKAVRNTIAELKADADRAVYSDVFPGVRIRQGDSAMNLWSLEEGYQNYLATSPTGTSTGFGADLLILDDLIKLAIEANNSDVLEKLWLWYTNTMIARLEEGAKVIFIMTRWHTQDPAGRALAYYQEAGTRIRHISYKALQNDGTMLCPEILSRASYEKKTRAMGADIAAANYQQEPIDIKGRLYSKFKTYDKLPPHFTEIRNYTDTADTGDDYLCSIDYGVYNGEAYALNVLYTKAPMEKTEPATAQMLHEDGVNVADIESNSGGRGFARAVERTLREEYRSNHTKIKPFHQSKNKQARIISNATWVMEHFYFPANWRDRWPEYYQAMTTYQREGKNKHDDAPDCTTGIAEKTGRGSLLSFQ
ncbi:MAG: phage terminase large subunit [Clostridiales bacterium]|nr:phage terminase large subunit [Clostridiales bacterium]